MPIHVDDKGIEIGDRDPNGGVGGAVRRNNWCLWVSIYLLITMASRLKNAGDLPLSLVDT
ncbi:MAG: hypothetical protein ACE1ZA_21690 [Pseudomonadales bacterium]